MGLVREIWFNVLLKPKGIPFKSHSLWSSLGPGTVSCPVMEDSVMSESPLGWLLSIIPKKTQKIVSVGKSEVAQSCPTLCDPMDCSLSSSSVHGIFQARVLEWFVISFSKDVGKSEPLCTAVGNVKYCSALKNTATAPKRLKTELTYFPAIPLIESKDSKRYLYT